MGERQHLAELVARYGCPLVAAARHPEHRGALMALNAKLEMSPPTAGSDAAAARVQHALEDVLRVRVRARRARLAA